MILANLGKIYLAEKDRETLPFTCYTLSAESNIINNTVHSILRASLEYNKTIHSFILNTSNPVLQLIKEKLTIPDFREQRDVGYKVYLKTNKRLDKKLSLIYSEEKILADLGTYVLIMRRVVQKDNLR